MQFKAALATIAISFFVAACGGGGGSSPPLTEGQKSTGTSEPAPVSGGTPGAPTVLSLSLKNSINNSPFNNYFKYAGVAGERLVLRVNLTLPLSDLEFSRCASSPGTGATPSSYSSQIHVYNANNVRVGGMCGESLTYMFSETGTYVFNFEFPSNGTGYFNTASLRGDTPVSFSEVGTGAPDNPKKMSLSSANAIGSDVFYNYYWVSAVKGETLVVNASLNQPLSTQQKTRCASNPNSHNSQIYVFDSKLKEVGLTCGESLRFVAPETGNYVLHFSYGAQSPGVVNAAKI